MKKLFLILTLSTACLSAHATDVLRLNLNQAIELALNENRIVKIADMEIQRVDYSQKSAWHNILPSLDASGNAIKYLVPGEMAMMGMVMKSPVDFNVQAGLNLSLPLFVPALWHTIKMTTLDMQLAVEKANASKITLRNDVTKAFYGVLLAKDSYKILQDGLALVEEVHQQAKRLFEVGLATELDVISAEVQVKNLQPTIMEVENGIEQAKMFLKVLMGVDIKQAIEIEGSLIDYGATISHSNAGRNLSIDENTDLRQLDIAQQQLQRALSMQRTQRMPTLVAFGSYGYTGMGNRATNTSLGPIPVEIEKSTDWFSQGLMAGVQLNIPLSGIFTNATKEKQTKVQINQLAEQRNYMEDMLNMQVRTALNNMDRAAKQAEVAKKNEDLAQRGYDIALKRYETGMGIMLEVQNASNQLMQAQLLYNQAIASYLNTKSDLEKLLGHEK
ncbi:MAG: TolC family protein [Bacteroidales bacterium]|nr:TolC family protein [Bacteroidales bacterium]